MTNLSTFLIYGALYVVGYQQSIFSQGTLGYSAAGGRLHRRAGRLAAHPPLVARRALLGARYGPRRFMAVGPAVMGVGILWLARMPASSAAWNLQPGDPASWLPSGGYLVDFLPSTILFGLGLAITVAPLTTALMASVPENRAGLGSAVNNAISRVGPQLAGALDLRRHHRRLLRRPGESRRPASTRPRRRSAPGRGAAQQPDPVGRPGPGCAPPGSLPPTRSTWPWAIAAGLLLAGAATNALGIRDPARRREPERHAAVEASDEPGGVERASRLDDSPTWNGLPGWGRPCLRVARSRLDEAVGGQPLLGDRRRCPSCRRRTRR